MSEEYSKETQRVLLDIEVPPEPVYQNIAVKMLDFTKYMFEVTMFLASLPQDHPTKRAIARGSRTIDKVMDVIDDEDLPQAVILCIMFSMCAGMADTMDKQIEQRGVEAYSDRRH